MSLLTTIYEAVPAVAASAAPGLDKLQTILSWFLGIAALACVGSVIKSGLSIALAGHGRGGGAGEHGMSLVLSLLGTAVCGAAFLLVSSMGL